MATDILQPVEIAGIFAHIKRVVREYGRHTKQHHVTYCDFLDMGDDKIITIQRDTDWPNEPAEVGEVSLLAFRDMLAAVQIFEEAQKAEKERRNALETYGEYGRYLRLREMFEGKEPPPNPYKRR